MSDVKSQQSSDEVGFVKDEAISAELPSVTLQTDVAQNKALESRNTIGAVDTPVTPIKGKEKLSPKEPVMTPRLKKKIPWKGKNIVILVPRDDERGLPGGRPTPLRPHEVEKMYASWKELGYSVDGFDLLVDDYQPPGTSDSQSRSDWPAIDDMTQERASKTYKVLLPDLNAWKRQMEELQEAKLRALGVDELPEPSISPPTTVPSRQASAQHPSNPFSPPIPTSSASSNHGLPPYPFPTAQFLSGTSSPGASPVPFAPGKFNPRQSISLPAGNSPFQLAQSQNWNNTAGFLPGLHPTDTSLAHINGILSPLAMDGRQQVNSPVFGLHQRHQSLQFFPQQMVSIASPRLQDVREDDEEDPSKSPSKTPEPTMRNDDPLQAEIWDAQYHLEEQLRNQLEHEDYNPRSVDTTRTLTPLRSHGPSSQGLIVAERFANEPGKPMELHHPRPHSRGHSLSKNFFRDHDGNPETLKDSNSKLSSLKEVSEARKEDDETQEIETNPSNLGTPVQNFDFVTAFGQHHKTLSSVSNPWSEQQPLGGSSAKHSRHGSKASLSKLNVQAPEFKFNPANTFVPGMYTFASSAFQPAVFQAGVGGDNHADAEPILDQKQPTTSIPQFGASRMHASAPSFSPGQGVFSFSTSGPKFRPDAPSFTPFQPLAANTGAGRGHTPRQDSIFGNISITANDIIRPVKKSKAIPIVRPSSQSSIVSNNADETHNGSDRHNVADESRVKRAKSAVPDGIDALPTFAERPEEEELERENIHNIKALVDAEADPPEGNSDVEDKSANNREQILPVDTSVSSTITSDQTNTMITTAEPSEASPAKPIANNFTTFDFEANIELRVPSLGEKRPEDEGHNPLSATTEPFVSDATSHTAQPAIALEDDKRIAAPSEEQLATSELTPLPRAKLTPKPRGLAASRFATPQPTPATETRQPGVLPSIESDISGSSLPKAESHQDQLVDVWVDREPTLEEIDAVMQQMETDPSLGVNKKTESSHWSSQPADALYPGSTEELQPPADKFLQSGTRLTPRQPDIIPSAMPLLSTELEDPFVDPTIGPLSPELDNEFDEPHIASELASDWEGAFTEDEHEKLENRARFFDGRVNEVFGTLLASRLDPLEKTLSSIRDSLVSRDRRDQSIRRETRSMSEDVRDSDADDEDDEPAPQRSMSPRRDRKMEQIRMAMAEVLVAHQQNQPVISVADGDIQASDETSSVLKALSEIKEEFMASIKTFPRADVGDSNLQRRDVLTPGPEEHAQQKISELQAMMMDLGERLSNEQRKTEVEITERRAAQDAAAELNRKLQAAETRVEVEIINRSVFDQRVTDLEERLRLQEDKTEEEVKSRRAAEDRLSEVQRLLRISSEEESRLREVVEEKDARIKTLEQQSGKNAMRMTLLEAAQSNSVQSQSEMTNKYNALEADLKAVRQDNNHWRSEAERADENARRAAGELAHTVDENKYLQRSLNTLTAQLEENERLRESWRAKFMSLQEDMGKAAREVSEENARRIKRDQAMLARQEVLDARLQAEAKTRERLEVEMERLQDNERSGMRALNECKRLEGLLGELRTEKYKLQQAAARYQREFEEARESGASEVKRTRMSMQTEIDAANNQVNVIREELEEQNSKLRAELDNIKLEVDTAKVQNEMLLEEAQSTKVSELEAVRLKNQNEIEDMQARYERQISNTLEDASRSEQQLLERLSLSSSKIEHLQDRVLHLEDKLEIAKEAAAAAAQAVKAAGVEHGTTATIVAQPKQVVKPLDLPEKISPQALRESIMVLQEQLQAREQRIEELEQSLSKTDPDIVSKISKRDDEISWLRELLAVRHGDLQDIITALSKDQYDRDTVKDATIRLKANLQMEEQERERAMNGGSAISLPNIAQSIQAATPRVAQTIGPIAAAWGNWRKSNQPSFRTISGVLSSPAPGHNATPSKSRTNTGSQSGLLSGLLTPPASGLRQTPASDKRPQPTAFVSTGRRYNSQGSSSLGRTREESAGSRRTDKIAMVPDTPPCRQERGEQPRTPPMMRESGYDSDAQPGDFDDHDFFEED